MAQLQPDRVESVADVRNRHVGGCGFVYRLHGWRYRHGTCDAYDETGNCIGDIHIFNGNDSRCRSDGLTIGFDDCCKDDEYWFGLGQCKVDERQLATSKAEGLCYYIGEYCSEEIDLGFGSTCIEHEQTYCCFNSKLSRIVHEQGRSQLQGDISDWGEAEEPNCRGFTPEEFQMLDFSRIDLSEWFGDIEVKAQGRVEDEMQEAIEGLYDTLLIPTINGPRFSDYFELSKEVSVLF